jgi:hypothetical protein
MHLVVFTAWTLALIATTDAYAILQAPRVARGAVRGACGIPIFRVVETQRSFHSKQQRKRGGALELLQTSTSTYNESASFGERDSQWYLKQITKAWCSNYQGLVKESALDELDSIWGSRVSVLLKREVLPFVSFSSSHFSSPHCIFSLFLVCSLALNLSSFFAVSLLLRIRRLDTHSMFAVL